MIEHIIWFIVGVIVGTLGAGFFFAGVRDREQEAMCEFLHEERKLREEK